MSLPTMYQTFPAFDEHGEVTNLDDFKNSVYMFTNANLGMINVDKFLMLSDNDLYYVLNNPVVIWYIVASDYDLIRGKLEKYLVKALLADAEKIMKCMVFNLKIDFFKNTFTNTVCKDILVHNWDEKFTLIPLLKVFNSDYFDTTEFKKLILKDGKDS